MEKMVIMKTDLCTIHELKVNFTVNCRMITRGRSREAVSKSCNSDEEAKQKRGAGWYWAITGLLYLLSERRRQCRTGSTQLGLWELPALSNQTATSPLDRGGGSSDNTTHATAFTGLGGESRLCGAACSGRRSGGETRRSCGKEDGNSGLLGWI